MSASRIKNYKKKIAALDREIAETSCAFSDACTKEGKDENFRKRNALYSQRKYYKRKLRKDLLLHQKEVLEEKNEALREENKSLEYLLDWAEAQVKEHEEESLRGTSTIEHPPPAEPEETHEPPAVVGNEELSSDDLLLLVTSLLRTISSRMDEDDEPPASVDLASILDMVQNLAASSSSSEQQQQQTVDHSSSNDQQSNDNSDVMRLLSLLSQSQSAASEDQVPAPIPPKVWTGMFPEPRKSPPMELGNLLQSNMMEEEDDRPSPMERLEALLQHGRDEPSGMETDPHSTAVPSEPPVPQSGPLEVLEALLRPPSPPPPVVATTDIVQALLSALGGSQS